MGTRKRKRFSFPLTPSLMGEAIMEMTLEQKFSSKGSRNTGILLLFY